MHGEPFSYYWEFNNILLEMGKQLKKNLRIRGDDYDK